jgi:hypothetical protein
MTDYFFSLGVMKVYLSQLRGLWPMRKENNENSFCLLLIGALLL